MQQRGGAKRGREPVTSQLPPRNAMQLLIEGSEQLTSGSSVAVFCRVNEAIERLIGQEALRDIHN